MKATLINPAVAWDALDNSWIRHGIASISSYAKSKGHDIDLIDLRRMSNQQGIDWQLFDKAIEDSGSNVFGISVISANFDFARECIKRIRLCNTKAKIAVGGIHPTVEPDESKELNADCYFKGEGEYSFTAWLDAGCEVDKDDNNYFSGPDIMKPNLDSLPFADREIFSPVRELPIGYLPEPFSTIIIGRGCPYRCTFCFPAERTLFGKKVRMRSVDNVLGELLELKEDYGLSSFLIHDDAFTSFPSYCHEFVEKKVKLLPGVEFYCQARADHIVERPEMIKDLYRAGLRGCLIGHESGSQRVLDFLHKDTTVEQNIRSVEILNSIGIIAWSNIMLGLPTETLNEATETILMAKKIKKIQQRAIISIAVFTPHPGSDLYDYCMERNLSLIKQHSDYRRYFDGTPKIKGVNYQYLSWAISQIG